MQNDGADFTDDVPYNLQNGDKDVEETAVSCKRNLLVMVTGSLGLLEHLGLLLRRLIQSDRPLQLLKLPSVCQPAITNPLASQGFCVTGP